MKTCVLLVLVMLGWVMNPVHAQIYFDGCTDANGVPVVTRLDDGLPVVAMAATEPDGRPVIRYNPHVLAWLAPPTRLFFFAHECARVQRGYGVAHPLPAADEGEADCVAITALNGRGLLGERDLGLIEYDIGRLGRRDWAYLPGAYRILNLQRCLRPHRAPFEPEAPTSSCCDANGRKWCPITDESAPRGECTCGGMLRRGWVCR